MNNLTKSEFMKIYNEGKNLTDKPIFIKFHATWCGPCKMYDQVLNKVIPDFKDQVGNVNVSLKSRYFPTDTQTVKGPFFYNTTSTKINTRTRGRQIAIRLESNGYNNDTNDIFQRTASEQVNTMLNLAEIAGIDGVVCSPNELDLVSKRDSLLSITPGIRIQNLDDDQKRVMSPKEAIELGADYIVIGRPITSSANIKQSLNDIYESIQ